MISVTGKEKRDKTEAMASQNYFSPPPNFGGGLESPLPSSPESSLCSVLSESRVSSGSSLPALPMMKPAEPGELACGDLTPEPEEMTCHELTPEMENRVARHEMTPERDEAAMNDVFSRLTSTPLGKAPPNSVMSTPDMKTSSRVSSMEVFVSQ